MGKKKFTPYTTPAELEVHEAAKELERVEYRIEAAKAAGASRRRLLELADDLRNTEERLENATVLARRAMDKPEPRPKPKKLGITF